MVKEVIKEDPEFHQKVHRSHVDRVANTLKTWRSRGVEAAVARGRTGQQELPLVRGNGEGEELQSAPPDRFGLRPLDSIYTKMFRTKSPVLPVYRPHQAGIVLLLRSAGPIQHKPNEEPDQNLSSGPNHSHACMWRLFFKSLSHRIVIKFEP